MIEQVVTFLVQSSWQILILTAVVWPLSRMSIRSYPNFAYLLWTVILIKALVPFNFTLPTQQLPVVEMSPIITGQFIVEASAKSAPAFTFTQVIALLWGLGVAFFSIKLFISETANRKRLNGASEVSSIPWINSMVTQVGIGREVKLFTHDSVTSPFMQGLWKVRIYFPNDFFHWSDQEKQTVLAHELMHVKRFDMVIIYLQAIARTLYFFHPAVWLINDQIDLEREKICDDTAIEFSKSTRTSYGEQLFRQLKTARPETNGPVLAGGFFMSDSSVIKRFRYIKEKRGTQQSKLKLYHLALIFIVILTSVIIACDVEKTHGPINSTDIGPIPELNKNVVFQKYDEPPKPVGGYRAIQEAIEYPESARAEGLEGTTIVQITLDSLGMIKNVIILKSSDNDLLDAAAIIAIEKVQWEPAKQDGKGVGVRVSVPVVFSLQSEKSDATKKDEYKDQIVRRDDPRRTNPWPVDWKLIQQNIVYPKKARDAGVKGSVMMRFTIDENGKLIDPEVVSGPKHPALKRAAVEALTATQWLPALKNGVPIAGTMEMGIGFGIDSDDLRPDLLKEKLKSRSIQQ